MGKNLVHFCQQNYHVAPWEFCWEFWTKLRKKKKIIYLPYDRSGVYYKEGSKVEEIPAVAIGELHG